jgi:WD40 repeat protein
VLGSYDRSIRIWNVENGECLHVLNGHADTVYKVLVFKNLIISASLDHTIQIWDLDTGKNLRILKGHSHWVNDICIVEDNIVSCSADKCIRIWEIQTGKCLRILKNAHEDWINCICSDSESFIVSGSEDSSIKSWSLSIVH